MTTTSESRTVAYMGTVDSPQLLILDSHSFITGYDAVRLEFKLIELACSD